jgi:hypothetical protein
LKDNLCNCYNYKNDNFTFEEPELKETNTYKFYYKLYHFLETTIFVYCCIFGFIIFHKILHYFYDRCILGIKRIRHNIRRPNNSV